MVLLNSMTFQEQWSPCVCLLVCLSVTIVNPAKMAESIEMPFALWTWVDPMNYVLHRGPDPPWEGAILVGENGGPL